MRILVIDDNPDDRHIVLRELEFLFPEAEVITPVDLAGFNGALEAQTPDLVVTDLDIHWTNGSAVLSSVKALYPGCPVVMFTGTGDEIIAVELMKSGLDDYVVKSPRQLGRLRICLKLAVEAAKSRSALSKREAELTAMVAHRDTIVRELHHRVKNNLQTMISLLQMRSRGLDPTTQGHLTEIVGRMQALGAVQARIYQFGNLDRVDFCMALSDIAETLADVYGHSNLDRKFDGPLPLAIDRAVPLALICYEVILNALKYAWPDPQRGKLSVRVRTALPFPEVHIEDDGIGFAAGEVVKGLGTRLVRSLAEEAHVEVVTLSKPGDGTAIILRLV